MELLGETSLLDAEVDEGKWLRVVCNECCQVFWKLMTSRVYGPVGGTVETSRSVQVCLLPDASLQSLRNLLLSLRSLFYTEVVSHRQETECSFRYILSNWELPPFCIHFHEHYLPSSSLQLHCFGMAVIGVCWIGKYDYWDQRNDSESRRSLSFHRGQENMRKVGEDFPALKELS